MRVLHFCRGWGKMGAEEKRSKTEFCAKVLFEPFSYKKKNEQPKEVFSMRDGFICAAAGTPKNNVGRCRDKAAHNFYTIRGGRQQGG